MTKPEPIDKEHEVKNIDLIVSKSDAQGNITYVNPVFVKISGYTQASLLEQPHAIVRHPDMPKVIFHYLWEHIQQGQEIFAYVKNLCADGGFYWVLANVKMAKNPDGTFRNYMSTRKRVLQEAKERIAQVYARLLEIEKTQSYEASQKAFEAFLENNNITTPQQFNDYMKNLNKGN